MADDTDQNANPENPGAATDKTQPATPAAGTVDVQAQINEALTKQQEQFNAQFKEATGHPDLKTFTEAQLQQQGKLQELADSRKAGEEKYKSKFEQAAIGIALMAASSEALDPEIIKDLLSGKAVVDDKDNVTIDGKPVAEAVQKLLEDRPYLAKAQGGPGSGAPQNPSGGNQITRAEFEKLDHPGRAKFIQAGGKII